MNFHRTRIALCRSAMVAAIAWITTASAVNAQSPAYAFKIVQSSPPAPTERSVTVELLDTSNGQPVADAQLDAVRTVYAANPKVFPSVRQIVVALKPDGHGGYVYSDESLKSGSTLRLRARLPGRGSPVWGTVHVGD